MRYPLMIEQGYIHPCALKQVSISTLTVMQESLSSGDPAFLDIRGLYTVEAAAMVNAELEARR